MAALANVALIAVMIGLAGLNIWLLRRYGLAGVIGFLGFFAAIHLWHRWRCGYWIGDRDEPIDLD